MGGWQRACKLKSSVSPGSSARQFLACAHL
jgi:hypothetical protein